MTDLIKEVLRSNELRMNEDYSYTMNNGEVQINQPSSRNRSRCWAKYDTGIKSIRSRQCHSQGS